MFEGVRHAGMLHFDVSPMSRGAPVRIDLPAAPVAFERAMPHERKTAVLHSYASAPVGRPHCGNAPFRRAHSPLTGCGLSHAEGRASADMTDTTVHPTTSHVVSSTTKLDRADATSRAAVGSRVPARIGENPRRKAEFPSAY